jgi:hypothetical protein
VDLRAFVVKCLFMLPHLTTHGAVCREPHGEVRVGGPRPLAVLPGSFNPLHHGHTSLAAVAAARLGVAVEFELSLANVDKPELGHDELQRRLGQFDRLAPVWVTRAATFAAKAELFPGAAFVVGWDTAVRLIDVKYYGNDRARRDAGLRLLRERRCRVVVGGRLDPGGAFRTWTGEGIADDFGELFLPLTEDAFRADVSSSEIRAS